MTEELFLLAVPYIPVSVNASPQRKTEFARRLNEVLKKCPTTVHFSGSKRLYAKVFYFNHERASSRDVHNILKPLFDLLRGVAYEDDKQIVHFEAFRLEMERHGQWFDYSINGEIPNEDELLQLLLRPMDGGRTGVFIEIGEVPSTNPVFEVNWLS
jgi:Endodeoxyribonuclease RusA